MYADTVARLETAQSSPNVAGFPPQVAWLWVKFQEHVDGEVL